jgi:hypothetical protein
MGYNLDVELNYNLLANSLLSYSNYYINKTADATTIHVRSAAMEIAALNSIFE